MNEKRLKEARKVFDIEIEALNKTKNALDDIFYNIVDSIINCKGKVVVTGMGKSGHIAAKMAATFASLGTQSFFLHPAEAMHGDLGMISREDIVIAISYSGESDEIIRIIPSIKIIGAKLIGITGNINSTLSRLSDIVQVLPDFEEACHLGLAPTSSTTAVLCYGDALAVVASEEYGFTDVDFGRYHPAGALGKKIVAKVDDLMVYGEDNPMVLENSTLQDAIVELSKRGLGIVSVVDAHGVLLGVITDGDMRRLFEKQVDIYKAEIKQVMTEKPITIQYGKLAVEALNIMREKKISCLPVVKERCVVGTIRIHDIVNYGIVG